MQAANAPLSCSSAQLSKAPADHSACLYEVSVVYIFLFPFFGGKPIGLGASTFCEAFLFRGLSRQAIRCFYFCMITCMQEINALCDLAADPNQSLLTMWSSCSSTPHRTGQSVNSIKSPNVYRCVVVHQHNARRN